MMGRLFLFIIFGIIDISAQSNVIVNIDLGGNPTQSPWNTISSPNEGLMENLVSMRGVPTSIDIAIASPFNGVNTNGSQTPNSSLNFPPTASGDSFFGNREEFSGATIPSASVLISDLDTDKPYTITLFASRLASDNRETEYQMSGNNIDTTMYLNVSDNSNNIVVVEDIMPLDDGTIKIEATTGPNNNNSFGFYYLGIIRIEYKDILIPLEPKLSLTSPTGGEYWQTGSNPEIRWKSQGIDSLEIAFSTDSGNTWEDIAKVSALSQAYNWSVPSVHSQNCMIRLSTDENIVTSQNVFEINKLDTSHHKIVVLGSSTAAGTGPSSRDSAWVWMYTDTLAQNDTRFSVTNLARGGFTTYNILPDNTTIPTNINQVIDTDRNITKALSFNPQAIIINLPSNDAARGYRVSDQLNNYEVILEGAKSRSIPTWICTPQPRNNFSSIQKMIQRDLIDSTYARFGEMAIDFWSGLEDGEANIESIYDSGDGVHLENSAHKILLQRVLDRNISEYLLSNRNTMTSSAWQNQIARLHVFPNPSTDSISLKNITPPFDVYIYDPEGRLIFENKNYSDSKIKLVAKGRQFVKIIKGDLLMGSWVDRM